MPAEARTKLEKCFLSCVARQQILDYSLELVLFLQELTRKSLFFHPYSKIRGIEFDHALVVIYNLRDVLFLVEFLVFILVKLGVGVLWSNSAVVHSSS